jgi:hypothetical protein
MLNILKKTNYNNVFLYNNKKITFDDYKKNVIDKYFLQKAIFEIFKINSNKFKVFGFSNEKNKYFGLFYKIKTNTKNKIISITGNEFKTTKTELKTLLKFGLFQQKDLIKNKKNKKTKQIGGSVAYTVNPAVSIAGMHTYDYFNSDCEPVFLKNNIYIK